MTNQWNGQLRKRFVAVSFKTYLDHEETVTWTQQLVEALGRDAHWSATVDVIEFPSFPSIPAVVALTRDSGIQVGAQDLSDSLAGPYTGEVTAQTLRQVGCSYVEVGHAERRLRHGEADAAIGRKLAMACQGGLTPLLCVGEPEPGDASAAGSYCVGQVTAALDHAAGAVDSLVVAYEPVWAIGAEAPASEDHIRTVCRIVRAAVEARWPKTASPPRVVYGGSAGPGLFQHMSTEVDGLFLGRSAHDPTNFIDTLTEVTCVD